MSEYTFKAVWTGATRIWAYKSKVGSMRSTEIVWPLYQARHGLVKRLLPLPVFLSEYLPGNEGQVCDKLGIERCGYDELCERYEAGEFDEAEDKPEPQLQPEQEGLEALTNEELRDMCRERDLPIYGAKADLIERLESS